MRRVSDAQVRRLREEMSKHGHLGRASMRADMDRKTARKYLDLDAFPSTCASPRTWRTREDPFAAHHEWLDATLREMPALEAKTLFEMLCEKHPDDFELGQLRTMQRWVHLWRAQHDDVTQLAMLAQCHRPGEAAQTDFTSTGELEVTIAGEPWEHKLCVFVLPFSNWMWLTAALSESMPAIKRGVQQALFELGKTPQFHQTDNSTAATHKLSKEEAVTGERERGFNEQYLALMRHYGMTPRTIEIGESRQNGDVEAGNGAVKRALNQALLVRGSRDFESIEAYERFVQELARKRNKSRGARVAQELDAMRALQVEKLAEYVEERIVVSSWSTIPVRGNSYSVPSRLMGEELIVKLYEDRIEASFAGKTELCCPRLIGRKQHRIDYRHVVWSLLRKPGGFERYVYREEMFPTLVFRRTYDALGTRLQGTARDVAYLRVLHLAASTMQCEVEAELARQLERGEVPMLETVRGAIDARTRPTVPAMVPLKPELAEYDALLTQGAA